MTYYRKDFVNAEHSPYYTVYIRVPEMTMQNNSIWRESQRPNLCMQTKMNEKQIIYIHIEYGGVKHVSGIPTLLYPGTVV